MVKIQDNIVSWKKQKLSCVFYLYSSSFLAVLLENQSNMISINSLKNMLLQLINIFPVYVDMGTLASDTATLSFAFKGESTLRAWEVKVSQIPCAASYA